MEWKDENDALWQASLSIDGDIVYVERFGDGSYAMDVGGELAMYHQLVKVTHQLEAMEAGAIADLKAPGMAEMAEQIADLTNCAENHLERIEALETWRSTDAADVAGRVSDLDGNGKRLHVIESKARKESKRLDEAFRRLTAQR